MSIYPYFLVLFCYGIGIAPRVLHDVHMLQLNSYRIERYLRWLRQEPHRSIHPGPIGALALLLLWPWVSPTTMAVVWSLVFLVLFQTRDRTPRKKKLVITSRVSRLLAAHTALVAGMATLVCLAFAAAGYSGFLGFLLSLSISAVVSPWLTASANALMQPIERAVARRYYHDARRILSQYPNLLRIGITGSYGKTSTKFILQQCLSARYNTLATPESYNTTLGVIRVIRTLLRPIHDIFIVEMGARQQGDIQEICELVHPRIGIITAIGEQHLETFHDLATIAKTKLELFEALPADGLAFYNADDENLAAAAKPRGPRYVSYGIDATDANYRATELVSSRKGTEFNVRTPSGDSLRFRTRLLGRHNLYNILAGISVGIESGLSLAELVPVIASLKPAPHRLEARQTASGITILDNAFSSNPRGAKSSLEVLAAIEGERKIMITPGMVELGSREYALNKVFGAQAADVCDHIVLVGPKRAVAIREGLLEAGYPEDHIYIAADLKDGQNHLDSMVKAGDVILYENDLPDTYNEARKPA